MKNTILSVQNLSVKYGTIFAVNQVSLSIDYGEMITLIGANGAGKSSLMNAIAGSVQSIGSILFAGNEIQNFLPEQRVKKGISLVPEGRGIFYNLSVIENLMLGSWSHRQKYAENLERVFSFFPRLKERYYQLSGTLSGGEQQMLAIGRALMGNPSLLLLDEPSMGLSPKMIEELFIIVKNINKSGVSIFLIEQNAMQSLKVTQRGYLLAIGRIILSECSNKMLNNPLIKKIYLGSNE